MKGNVIRSSKSRGSIVSARKQVTYLLGAGASAQTIPVVAFLTTRIRQYTEVLNDASRQAGYRSLAPYRKTLKEIVVDLQWLLSQADTHYTIDTLAKKFYLIGHWDALKRLKRALTFYFVLEQVFFLKSPKGAGQIFEKSPIDIRYDSFIAAIARRNGNQFELNPSIKILSWNYDLQVELSLRRFVQKQIRMIKDEFQILPHHKTYHRNEKGSLMDLSRFGMVKLNGNAMWDLAAESSNLDTIFDKHEPGSSNLESILCNMLDEYQQIFGEGDSLLYECINHFNFAWELDPSYEDIYLGYGNNIYEAEKISAETKVLVVIGYSFPVFNRELDKRVLGKMPNLEKIYIQDRRPDHIASTMRNAFNLTTYHGDAIPIQEETSLDQFVIPYELA